MLKENKKTINLYSYNICKIVSIMMAALLAGLCICASATMGKNYLFIYGGTMIAFLLLLPFVYISKKRNLKFIVGIHYALFLILYGFALIVCIVPLDKPHLAVTIMGIQLINPTLILDKTVRVSVVQFIVFIITSILAYFFKPYDIFFMDCITCACFTIAGCIIGAYLRYIQLVNMSNKIKIEHQRDTDALTRLGNRRVLFECLGKAQKGKLVIKGILMIDIDHFKLYNDSLGHQSGDLCLRRIGTCLSEFGQENNLTFYRYGGEEFIGISQIHDYEALGQIADKLRERVQSMQIPFKINNSGVVTISVGYAIHPQNYTQSYELTIQMADDSLYLAKNRGRNCCVGAEEIPPPAPLEYAELEELGETEE